MITERELVGTTAEHRATARKGASEVRVRVCATDETGVAVDVRRFITSLRTAPVTRGKASTYTGPTREGLWLQPSEAFELAALIESAAMAAESMGEGSA